MSGTRQPGRPPLPAPTGTFVSTVSFAIDSDGRIERRLVDQPRVVVASAPPLRVSLRPGLDMATAAKLLRLLAAQLERGA